MPFMTVRDVIQELCKLDANTQVVVGAEGIYIEDISVTLDYPDMVCIGEAYATQQT